MLKTLAIFGCCLHKQRVFERSTSGTHLFLPSWLNLFPRDFVLAFQLTVVCLYLYFSHFIFCLILEETGFCNFSSPSFLISENEFPKQLSLDAGDCDAASILSYDTSPGRKMLFLHIHGAEESWHRREARGSCLMDTFHGQSWRLMALTLIRSDPCSHDSI